MQEGEDKFNEEENFEPCISKYIEMLSNNESCFFDVEELETIADFFLDEGKTNKAVNALTFGITQHPFSSSLYLRKSQILASIGKIKAAHDCLDSVEAMDGIGDELCITRASLYSQEHKHDKAIEYFIKALELTEDFKEDILIDLAFEYENAEKYYEAIKCLKRVLRFNPENEAALYEMVYCYGQIDKTEDSIEYLNQFIEKNPYSFTAWYNLGNAYSSIEFHEKAIFAYDYCTVIDESFSSAYFNAANSYVALKKYKEAIKLYEETLEFESPQAVTLNYIGECYEKLEEFEKSETYFKKSLEIDNDYADAWIGLAIAKDNLNQEKESVGLIEQALNLKPDVVDYWHLYAESLIKNKRIEDGEIAYHKAIALSENLNIQLFIDYSEFKILHRSLEDGINALLELDEKITNHIVFYRLAALSLKNGKINDAVTFLEKALSENKDQLNLLTDYYPEALSFEEINILIEQYK